MHKEDIVKNAKFYEHFLNKWPVYLKGQTTLTKGPFLIEEIKIEWLDIPKTSYDMRYILRHKYDSKCTISVREGDIVTHPDDTYEDQKKGKELLKLSKKCIKYDRERPEFLPEYRNIPVESSLKALEELNRREFERIAAEPIRFNAEILKAINDEVKIDPIKFKEEMNAMFGVSKFEYKKIIFSGPCTIILWKDGTKTIAKTSSDEEIFDPEKGVAICFMKKMLGHTETNKILRKASEQYKEYIAENRPNSSFDEFIDFCKDYFKSETKSVNQSTIDEVKKVEEEQDDNLAVGSRCSTCEYFDKPMTKDPCCHCLSGDQYKKREEDQK